MLNEDEKYYVGALDVSIVNNLADIKSCYTPTIQEVKDYKSAVNNIDSQFKTDLQAWQLFEYSCNQLAATVERVQRAFTQVPRPTVDAALLEINANFLSTLNFMKTYLDYAQTRHHRGLSKEEKEGSKYTTLTSSKFDNSFEYRFAYKLRNYAQHSGFPITRLDGSSGFKKGTKDIEHTFHLSFERDVLLKNYDGWGAILKPELRNMDEYIDVMPIVDGLFEAMSELRAELLSEIANRLKSDYEKVKQMYSHTIGSAGTPMLLRVYGEKKLASGKELKIEQSVIPVALIKLLEEIYKTHGSS